MLFDRALYASRGHTPVYTGSGRKTWRFLSWNKMKSILSFYVNLLLKLSLTQSILITTFTSWIQCLWGGVPCCQHILPSISGSSASLVAACWEKLLPLLPWCSVSVPEIRTSILKSPGFFLLQSQGSSPDNVYGKSHLDDFDFVDVEGDMEAEMVRGMPRQRKKDVLEEG